MKRLLLLVFASLLISTSIPSMASANSTTSLVNTARAYIGTPYVYGGTTTSGFDCSGYIQFVFDKTGTSLPRSTSQQYAMGTSVAKNDLKIGDLVFFNTSGKGVSHAGIYIGSSKFIHASTSQGVMISSINDPAYWGSRYIGARRVKEFTPEATVAAAPVVDYITRADVAETLVQELALESKGIPATFSDVSTNHPHHAAILAVTDAGIFSGNEGAFNPDGQLTRAQLAKVLVEAFELEGTATTASFKDVSKDHWAADYINTLYSNNITTGYGDGNFGLNDKVTEAQFEKFIARLSH